MGNWVSKDLDYVINLVIRADAETDLTFSLDNDLGKSADFTSVHLTTGWQILSTSLTGLNHEASADEVLSLKASETFYIDSLILTEITDRFYLLKNSWQTPEVCDQDLDGNPRSGYMLGCDQYKDRAGKTHNLKQFNKLCSESAVGCEPMIDTKNSSDSGQRDYLNGDILPTGDTCPGADIDCVQVPADSAAYVVYDPTKLCGADAKGCERLGKPYQYENDTLYGDIYLKNNPDDYRNILCGSSAVGCDAFAYDNGSSGSGEQYFKDPGHHVFQ